MDAVRLAARVELDAGDRTFATGLMLDLVRALRETSRGDLVAVTTAGESQIAADLAAWSRLTGHAIVGTTRDDGRVRWVVRNGTTQASDDSRPLGERLWLYLNFDCNLRCDYCCVRSSPTAATRALGIERIRRIAREAPPLGVRAFFVTGGEPFLLPDIDEQLLSLAEAAPVTLLTNGMLLGGTRLSKLQRLPRDRVALQISLDSPTADLHDLHRGTGTWQRAMNGIEIARREGFRVRLAATVATDRAEAEFRAFLDRLEVGLEDRIIRRIALRGFATAGIALSRADLVPEITITTDGVYWHPVGAEDNDLLVTRTVFPLADAFDTVRRALAEERVHDERLASVYYCA